MTRFALRETAEPFQYLRTDIDSSGMSAMLVYRLEHADTWETDDDAAAFLRRVNERHKNITLEVVAC